MVKSYQFDDDEDLKQFVDKLFEGRDEIEMKVLADLVGYIDTSY